MVRRALGEVQHQELLPGPRREPEGAGGRRERQHDVHVDKKALKQFNVIRKNRNTKIHGVNLIKKL